MLCDCLERSELPLVSPLIAAVAEICFSCFSRVLALSYSSLNVSFALGAANFLCHLLFKA